MLIQLTKVREEENSIHPGDMAPGYQRRSDIQEKDFASPQVGKSFDMGDWRTFPVIELISPCYFRTENAIYHWTIINEANLALANQLDHEYIELPINRKEP